MRKMKDSGIEWIGEIPEEWKIIRLKFLIDCYDSQRIPVDASKREKGIYPYWGAGSIVDYVNDYLFDEELVLLGEDAAPFFDDTRSVAFLVNEKIWVNNHIHVLKPRSNINSSFLVHSLNSVDYHGYVNGSTRYKLTQRNMNEIVIACPENSQEQQQIADFLDEKCEKIDAIIATKKEQLEVLAEYKKSLIYEYVTGKREVA